MPRQKVPSISKAIFSVILDKGKAMRHRLPMTHVISTLRELDFMIRELGQKIQRDRGVQAPDGDFGIELLATSTGLVFRKGSVKAQAEITKDVDNGIETITQIIGTTNIVDAKKEVVSVDEYGAPVVRRLAKIAPIQEQDETELKLQLAVQGKIVEKSRFGKSGLENIRKLSAAEFQIESLTVYGKLRRLTDRSLTDEEDDIWGELIEDNGNKWRMKFIPADLKKVRALFTRQVVVIGDAYYFKTTSPRLNVKDIQADKPRNYLAAFNAFGRKYKDVFGNRTPKEILDDIRG